MSEHPIYRAERVELSRLVAYLQERVMISQAQQRAAVAGEFAHHHPEVARRACDQVTPPNRRIR